ncbi:MAG: hypothetical protein NT070_16090 [Cyanobacteria bacterium]|nr:hypothetical protein [Cyanobacteriota bacterium]
MQMLTEIGADNNTTTLVMMPSEFINMARTIAQSSPQSPTISPIPEPIPFNPIVRSTE